MAKKIRFPLKMKETDVRTIEELREYFDLESVLGYFSNGKLVTWLKDRYYDNEAMEVEALSADDTDFNRKLMSVLSIESDMETEEVDMEAIQRRNEKLMLLRQITDDKELIDNVDFIAFNQDDLLDILDECADKIYLCQGDFDIPLSVENVTYIGLNNPVVLLRAYDNVNFSSLNIKFIDICFGWDISSCTSADRLYQAEALIVCHNYTQSIPILEQLASEENFRAMMILSHEIYGRIYPTESNIKTGNLYDKRIVEAGEVIGRLANGENSEVIGKVLYKLANKGDKNAMAYYGFYCYLNEDRDNAIKYLKMSAERSNITAIQLLISLMLGEASGYEKFVDIHEAIEYMKKSCMLGDAKSMHKFAGMYQNGNKVSKNDIEAFKLYKLAAENGYALSQNKVGLYYFNGDSVKQDYSMAFKWFRKSAEQGVPGAQYNLGWCYECENGTAQSYSEALKWYKKAADQGNSDAQYRVGLYYEGGYGVDANFATALKWYQKAAEQGQPQAENAIGYAYKHGQGGLPQDYAEAVKWYKKSAEHGYAEGQNNLGWCYQKGVGVHIDRYEAIKWYKLVY